MEERIQKILTEYGIASRREAERMIEAGIVRINGRRAEKGEKADARRDRIEVGGNPLPRRGERVYIMLHKPRGYVTTVKDERGRKTVMELVRDCGTRVYPVGRLDKETEGLLLLTNDGELTNRLTHPSYHVAKRYRVKVRRKSEEVEIGAAIKELTEPMELAGEKLRAAKVAVIRSGVGAAEIRMTIYEGKNRQIRRMCEAAGLEVIRLQREAVGPVEIDGLKAGKWRYLSKEEEEALGISGKAE